MKKDTNRLCVLVSIIVVMCLIITTSGYGQFTRSVVADSVGTSAPVYYQHERNVARAADNTILVAWYNGSQIVSSTFDEVFQIWSPHVQVSFAGDQANKVALIADAQGRIHAAWQQRATSGSTWEIYYAMFSGGSWSTPNPVSQDPLLDAEECSIEIDSNGDIVVVWNTDNESDGNEWILLGRSSNDGANWSIPDTLSSPDGIINGTSTTSGRVCLWAGSNGRIVAIWHEDYGNREREVYVNQYDGSDWSGEVVISDTNAAVNRNWYPNVAMDSQDNVYAVYATDINGVGLRHILLARKSWGGQFTLPYDTVYSDSSDFLTVAITIDQNDDIYVGFRRSIPGDTLSLEEVAYCTSTDGGTTWSAPTALSRPNHDAGYLTFVGHVMGDGVDAAWRESFDEFIDDQNPSTVLYAKLDFVTSIDEPGDGNIPFTFDLLQNYPNPFNPATQIKYAVRELGNYELVVYNMLGEKIRTLVSSQLSPGNYSVNWNGKNELGGAVASGIYFYRLSGENLSITKKMALIR
jgi:hypothetical protein